MARTPAYSLRGVRPRVVAAAPDSPLPLPPRTAWRMSGQELARRGAENQLRSDAVDTARRDDADAQ